jgi:hypothetical protein
MQKEMQIMAERPTFCENLQIMAERPIFCFWQNVHRQGLGGLLRLKIRTIKFAQFQENSTSINS